MITVPEIFLTIDTFRARVTWGEENIHIPIRDYAILLLLASEPRKVFHNKVLIDHGGYPDMYNLYVGLKRLRAKFGQKYIFANGKAGFSLLRVT